MDKRTLLAVVLSVIVITVGFMVQNMLYPAQPPVTTVTEGAQEPQGRAPAAAQGQQQTAPSATPQTAGTTGSAALDRIVPQQESISPRTVRIETDLVIATLSNRGGVLESFKLKEHEDQDDIVEMIFRGTEDQAAFNLSFGGPEEGTTDALFNVRSLDENSVEFSRTFLAPGPSGGTPFTLRKTYHFYPEEYMIELQVSIENSVNAFPNLSQNGTAYTLCYGPQIGPEFATLDNRNEFRKYYYYAQGDREEVKLKSGETELVEERVGWAAIAGKYFTMIAIPDATEYDILYSAESAEGLPEGSQLCFLRPPLRSSRSTDTFRFYIGPKSRADLGRYNDPENNVFGAADLNLDETIDSGAVLGWLQTLLRWILNGFYSFIPNYGVAIILLTVLIKVVLFPLTHKSYESTSKMQSLAPKMNELKERYKSNPQKLNQEMAELYRREGVSPLGGCLPMLLQIPIFFALYGLLNSYFALRGADFIPPWTTDLSAPESIARLPFQLPILGWTDIRLLPILFVGTQLLTQKLTTTPQASMQANMKMMMYMMPIVFFFILYDMPSGLLLYWTVMNVLTAGQQYYISRKRSNTATA